VAQLAGLPISGSHLCAPSAISQIVVVVLRDAFPFGRLAIITIFPDLFRITSRRRIGTAADRFGATCNVLREADARRRAAASLSAVTAAVITTASWRRGSALAIGTVNHRERIIFQSSACNNPISRPRAEYVPREGDARG